MVLEASVAIAFLIWLSGVAIAPPEDRPAISRWCVACMAALLVQGWWMTIAADPHLPLANRASHVLPRSIQAAESLDAMFKVSAALAMLLISADLARDARWRTKLWWTVSLTGAAVSVFGITEKIGVTAILAPRMNPAEGCPFGPFNYHGNAAAFINLVIPLALGLSATTLKLRKGFAQTTIAGAAAVACLGGAAAHVSRAGQVITAIVAAATLLTVVRANRGGSGEAIPTHSRRRSAVPALMLAAVAALCAWQGRASFARWADVGVQLSPRSGRLLVWRAAWPVAQDAGLWGNGPGTFKALFPTFPAFTGELGASWGDPRHMAGAPISIWCHAHNDYLQSVIEWGWLGIAPWAALIGIAMVSLLFGQFDTTTLINRIFRRCTGLALLGICLHSMMDFPMQLLSLQLYVATYVGLGWTGPDSG